MPAAVINSVYPNGANTDAEALLKALITRKCPAAESAPMAMNITHTRKSGRVQKYGAIMLSTMAETRHW